MLSVRLYDYYDALKIIHIIAFTSWMAGLFYLPRLYIYHVEKKDQQDVTSVFSVMEYRLYHYIMNPAMIVTVISGALLMVVIDALKAPWFHVKLLLVMLMISFHFFLHFIQKQFKLNKLAYSSRFLRIINEIPTLLLILIVILVIKKPF